MEEDNNKNSHIIIAEKENNSNGVFPVMLPAIGGKIIYNGIDSLLSENTITSGAISDGFDIAGIVLGTYLLAKGLNAARELVKAIRYGNIHYKINTENNTIKEITEKNIILKEHNLEKICGTHPKRGKFYSMSNTDAGDLTISSNETRGLFLNYKNKHVKLKDIKQPYKISQQIMKAA